MNLELAALNLPPRVLLITPKNSKWVTGDKSWLDLKQGVYILTSANGSQQATLAIKNGDPLESMPALRLPKEVPEGRVILVPATSARGKLALKAAKVGVYEEEGHWPVLIESIHGNTVSTNYGEGTLDYLWVPMLEEKPSKIGSVLKEVVDWLESTAAKLPSGKVAQRYTTLVNALRAVGGDSIPANVKAALKERFQLAVKDKAIAKQVRKWAKALDVGLSDSIKVAQ